MKKIKIFDLYFHFLLNRIVIISIFASLVFIFIILYLFAKTSYYLPSYLYNYDDIHYNYFRLSYFIIFIFNSIIIALISINYSISANNFDILFVSNESKIKLPLIKIFSGSIIIIIISIIEFLMLNYIEVIYFKYFVFEINDLFTLYQLILMGLLSYSLSLLISSLINQMIIPLLCMLISIIFKLICNNIESFKEIYEKIFPYYSYKENIYDKTGTFMGLIWLIFFILGYILIYDIKDIKC